MGELQIIEQLLAEWDTMGGPRQAAWFVFVEVDSNADGRLEWNNDEIRSYVRKVLEKNGCFVPNWPDHVWYEMYRACDVNHSYSLDPGEALLFARHCLEVTAHQINKDFGML